MDEKILQWIEFSLILSISGIITSIICVFVPQDTIGKTIVFGLVAFYLLNVIGLLLIPPLNQTIIQKLKSSDLKYYIFSAITLLFPTILFIFSKNIVLTIFSFLSWYILPVIAFTLAHYYELKKLDYVLQIAGILLFAIGFDARYTYAIVSGLSELKYELNALWVSALIILLYSIQLPDYNEKVNWQITGNKILVSILALIPLAVIIIPLGLFSNFLTWAPKWPGVGELVIIFLGIWLTVALPEELIARAVIQHQLTERTLDKKNKFFPYHKWIILVLSSFIFGLSHLNNASQEFAWIYVGFATFAGILYGIGWWYGGLFSAMLTHTLVDFIWALLLQV